MSVARSVVLVGKRYDRIGGWLILVAIGLIIAPLRIIIFIGGDLLPFFSSEMWAFLTTPGTEVYNPLWAKLLVFELIAKIGLIVFTLIVIVYFFRKRRILPTMMVFLLILYLILVSVDYFHSNFILLMKDQNSADTLRELIQSIIVCSIWVPYFLFSRRVKGTFVH